jgi:hypothetical protein
MTVQICMSIFILQKHIVLYIELEQCSCNDEKKKHTATDGEHIDGDRAQNLPRTYRQRNHG